MIFFDGCNVLFLRLDFLRTIKTLRHLSLALGSGRGVLRRVTYVEELLCGLYV